MPAGIREFFHHSSIQGLKYIAEDGTHYTQRVLWTISCLLSFLGMVVLSYRSYTNIVQNPVAFLVDRDYLGWNSTFPAVSVCEFDPDTGVISQPADRLFGENHALDLETFLREIVFFEGECISCENLCGSKINCTQDFEYLVDQVRAPCQSLLSECTWLGRPFDCCTYFRPLDTETGRCFSINSIQAGDRIPDKEMFRVNKKTGPGEIKFKVHKDANVYVHNSEEVPFINSPQEEKDKIFTGTSIEKSFTVTEIENDLRLGAVEQNRRGCKFPEERGLTAHPHYSYSACVVECRARAQLRLCACTQHFISRIFKTEMCDLEGLTCLFHHSKELGSLRTADSSKPGLVCPCYPSCTETDLSFVGRTEASTNNGSYSAVKIFMKSLPKMRFRRYIVRSTLDLVVSLGGTAGLFLGVSLISLIEIFYYGLVWRRNTTGENARRKKAKSQRTLARRKVSHRAKFSSSKTPIIPYLP